MATNEILPFCPTDTGTNLLTQSAYAAASDRTNGNQPGVASSKLVNKATRQATFIASQLAQYLANKTGSNIVDDGDAAALLAIMVSGLAPNDSFAIENLTLAAAVGASALTVSVKTQSGGNASATDQVFVAMRNATLGTGTFNRRNLQAALNIVISSGSTLGQVSGQASTIYIYLIDNAGTLELAVSHARYAENVLVSTTAEGGAGAADSPTAIYSTTARSNVPCRLIGILTNTQATAGTWATVPSQIQLVPFNGKTYPTQTKFLTGSGTYNVPAGATRIRVRAVGGGAGGAGSGTSGAGNGTAGNATTFGTTLISAGGGTGGVPNNSNGGAGGTGSLGTGPVGFIVIGGMGGAPGTGAVASAPSGGMGGSSFFGGAGSNSGSTNPATAGAGATNTGGGGGGGGSTVTNAFSGCGGGSGAYVEAEINCQNTAWAASYAYAVGASANGGAAGAVGLAGGAGGSGIIIIDEFYD